MEEFKALEDILKIDEKHVLLSQITHTIIDLNRLHSELSKVTLNSSAPNEIKSQFNVARNMALYTYFFYALAPEVHMKTFSVIEHALRLRSGLSGKPMLRKLLGLAIENGWLSDKGFRHIESPCPDNSYCKSLHSIIPDMRNNYAHGTDTLMPDFFLHITVCADLINQLFPNK